MTLTVGFDATAAARQGAGIGRYTRQLISALARRPGDVRFSMYVCGYGQRNGSLPALGKRFRVHHLPVSDRVMNAVWHRARLPLPAQIAVGRFDLFHSPDFTLPPTLGKPGVLTIHDLAFLRRPECAYPTLQVYLAEVVPRSARRAQHIIAVSESTRRDVIELLRIPPHRVTAIPEAAGEQFRAVNPRAARKAVQLLGIEPPFLLSVGTLEPRKNYARLLEAYAHLRERGVMQPLVIAGGRGWLYQPIFQRMRDLRLEPHVRFVRPDDRQLAALYSLADVFVYPSLYEGFGIPPLEALACGAPVACSNVSSLPEVVGDAALLFDPEDVQAIAASIERLLGDAALREALRERATAQVTRFSWDRAAQQTVDLYHEVAGA